MEGYDPTTYGERFAEVYDDWYGDITDTDACVAALAALAVEHGPGLPIFELGVGTGRLALPLARAGHRVVGVDASPAMLAALAAKADGHLVTGVLGDMADPPVERPDGGFGLAFVAYNTLFNLTAPGAQQACVSATAALLAEDGRFVVEAFVPVPGEQASGVVVPKQVTTDKVVLSVSLDNPADQAMSGQYIDITEAGITLRPWSIRWATPAQVDALAAQAGLVLDRRWADWSGTPFDESAGAHISIYRPG